MKNLMLGPIKTMFKSIIFTAGIFMSSSLFQSHASEKLMTHNEKQKPFEIADFITALERKHHRELPLEEEKEILNALSTFELGRFLLMNKGLNGYWTAYLILHGPLKNNLTPLEHWILHHAPTVKATRERFSIFQNVLQKHLKDNIRIASIPCGMMDDVITLDYSHTKDIQLVGIDLDEQSLILAKENAKNHNIPHADFIQNGAWTLNLEEEFDIMVSNGLNIYEYDDEKVTALYTQFYTALKPGGILITSFLTPPPTLHKDSPWKNLDPSDARKQKAIFTDIIGVSWQAFRTEETTRAQLKKAGFHTLDVIYDTQGIFPTIVAQKSTVTS